MIVKEGVQMTREGFRIVRDVEEWLGRFMPFLAQRSLVMVKPAFELELFGSHFIEVNKKLE